MVGRIDFDNLLKVHRVNLVTIANVIQSTELDFDLPRGFIGKVRKVGLFHNGLLSAAGANDFVMALVNDPDDTVTTAIPIDSVDHDVIASISFNIENVAAQPASWMYPSGYVLTFSELEDVVFARNMRFNSVGLAAVPTLGQVEVQVYYTLEKVTDADILNLLDIL